MGLDLLDENGSTVPDGDRKIDNNGMFINKSCVTIFVFLANIIFDTKADKYKVTLSKSVHQWSEMCK